MTDDVNRLSELLEQRLDQAAEEAASAAAASAKSAAAAPSAAGAPALKLPPSGTLSAAVEAILLVANEPMSVGEIQRILEGTSRAEVNAALRELRERYGG